MRENRTYGSEGGETGKPVFPTPIQRPEVADDCGFSRRFARRGHFVPRLCRQDAGAPNARKLPAIAIRPGSSEEHPSGCQRYSHGFQPVEEGWTYMLRPLRGQATAARGTASRTGSPLADCDTGSYRRRRPSCRRPGAFPRTRGCARPGSGGLRAPLCS